MSLAFESEKKFFDKKLMLKSLIGSQQTKNVFAGEVT